MFLFKSIRLLGGLLRLNVSNRGVGASVGAPGGPRVGVSPSGRKYVSATLPGGVYARQDLPRTPRMPDRVARHWRDLKGHSGSYSEFARDVAAIEGRREGVRRCRAEYPRNDEANELAERSERNLAAGRWRWAKDHGEPDEIIDCFTGPDGRSWIKYGSGKSVPMGVAPDADEEPPENVIRLNDRRGS